ncbi:MAG: signal peptide peptidase SppA [Planctomycetota bacterium]|nr:signal peptide peptidase SppA [Planctomycetota bacterium]
MSSQQPPPGPPPSSPLGQPPVPGFQPVTDGGRSVSFYVALFLTLLLLISGAINVVLLFFSALGPSTAGLADFEPENPEAGYRVVRVGGEKAPEKILRIRVEGAIAEAASPLMGGMGGSVTQIRRQLTFAARSKSIKGVLLSINSPGGGVTDSDEIHRLIEKFRNEHKKPVLAYFGDMSASGGYYIAAACDKIVCRPTTITGSIGVIMSGYNFAEAMKTIGVAATTIISPNTPYKDIMSPSRPMREDERKILTGIVEDMYQRFVDIVDAGRPKLSRDEVVALANGQIYSAAQAKANGLVDDILDPDAVMDLIKEMAGVEEAQLVEQRRLPSLMDAILGQASVGTKTPTLNHTVSKYLNQTTGAKFLYFWPGGR